VNPATDTRTLATRLPRRRPGVELARSVAAILLVLGAAAATLAALDRMPAVITGRAHGVARVSSVTEASRRLRARIILPAYFPETLAWPPAEILVAAGPPAAAAIEIAPRGGGNTRLVVAQTGAPGEVSELLLPGSPLDSGSPIKVGSSNGRLRRVIGMDGEVWWELAWTYRSRSVVMRSRGDLEQLLEMARSAREAP
jgi:hypothetical protein